MKLKKVEATEMDESSTGTMAAFPAVDAALAMGAAPVKRSGGIATLIAVLASLAAAAMVGAVAAMMYVNWELIANA